LFVSFVAGAALFGSAFLIPSFAVSVIAFRPTDAGQLLLPSGAFFVGTLLIAAFLMQVRRVPPVVTVPFWHPDDHGCDVDAVRLDQ
jgi:DHA2 family multidrug resistance protein